MERSQKLTTRASISDTDTAHNAKELWRMKMASKFHIVVSTAPKVSQSKQRGSSASITTRQHNHNSNSICKSYSPVACKQQKQRRQKLSQPQLLVETELLKDQEDYFGGESLWCKDVLEEISMVSYRATRMTTSVKKLFSEITTNARPLRKGETRDYLYLVKEKYEKEMETDYCIPSKPNTPNRSHGSKSVPIASNSNLANHTVHDGTEHLNCTSSQINMFHNRCIHNTNQADAIQENQANHNTVNTLIKSRPISTNSPDRIIKQSIYNLPLSYNENQPQLELSFKKAFLHTRHRITQWIKKYKE